MVAFFRVELAGSDDFGQLLHVGRFDVHYIKRLICYFHMPQINPEIKAKIGITCQLETTLLVWNHKEVVFQSFDVFHENYIKLKH